MEQSVSAMQEAVAESDKKVADLRVQMQYLQACETWDHCTGGCLSFGPIEKDTVFFVTLACARRTGAAARVECRRRER